MTDIFEPYGSTLITGGAIHKITREFRAIAGEDEHPTSEWVHNPDSTLVANDYWNLNVAEDALVEMTAQEKTNWDAAKQRQKAMGSVFAAIAIDPVIEPVVPGASKVVANDRPAIEVQNGVTGWGAIQTTWRFVQHSSARICARVSFILKASGTGGTVRIALRAKAQHAGEDSAATWADTAFVSVPISHATVGEVFEGCVHVDAGGFARGDGVALQIGRDGANDLSGTGDADDVSIAAQIIGLEITRV